MNQLAKQGSNFSPGGRGGGACSLSLPPNAVQLKNIHPPSHFFFISCIAGYGYGKKCEGEFQLLGS